MFKGRKLRASASSDGTSAATVPAPQSDGADELVAGEAPTAALDARESSGKVRAAAAALDRQVELEAAAKRQDTGKSAAAAADELESAQPSEETKASPPITEPAPRGGEDSSTLVSMPEPGTSGKDLPGVAFSTVQVLQGSTPDCGPVEVRSLQGCGERLRNSVRFFVMAVALLSAFLVSYQKTIISNVIRVMRDKKSADYVEMSSLGEGLLKAAYPFGHISFQVVSGRFSEMYGSFWVITLSLISMGAACMVGPLMLHINFVLMFVDMALLGLFSSLMTPALMTLYSNWLTPSEKPLFMSFYLVASRLGQSASSQAVDVLTKSYHYSWTSTFYSGGAISVLYSIVFVMLVRSNPAFHWMISKRELAYLASRNKLVEEALHVKREQQQAEASQQKPLNSTTASGVDNLDVNRPKLADLGKLSTQTSETVTNAGQIERSQSAATETKQQSHAGKKKPPKAPWRAILSNGALWAYIISKVLVKFSGDFLQNELPKYLKNIMHVENTGSSMALNYLIFCAGCLISGFLARYAIKHAANLMSKTTVRKLFQSFASFGVATLMLVVAFGQSSLQVTNSAIFVMFMVTTLSTAGEAQIVFDMTTRFPGTLHGMGSALASLVAVLQPIALGIAVEGKEHSPQVWRVIWMCLALTTSLGGLVFLLFADANIQKFDHIVVEEKDNKDIEAAKTQTSATK